MIEALTCSSSHSFMHVSATFSLIAELPIRVFLAILHVDFMWKLKNEHYSRSLQSVIKIKMTRITRIIDFQIYEFFFRKFGTKCSFQHLLFVLEIRTTVSRRNKEKLVYLFIWVFFEHCNWGNSWLKPLWFQFKISNTS